MPGERREIPQAFADLQDKTEAGSRDAAPDHRNESQRDEVDEVRAALHHCVLNVRPEGLPEHRGRQPERRHEQEERSLARQEPRRQSLPLQPQALARHILRQSMAHKRALHWTAKALFP